MEIKNVAFSYDEKPFIDGLNITIPRGKITTIMGPNGSGKSTVLSLLAKVNTPSTGEIIVGGKDIKGMKQRDLAKVLAVVHQQNSAPHDLTVEQLVAFGRNPHCKLFGVGQPDDDNIIQWAIQCTQLESLRQKYLHELSGGERQRAWIAMALAQKTEILFLDEPTTYLDVYYQIELLELVKELNEQYRLTIVMVLHDINQAIQYSDHVIVMKKGNVIRAGKPLEVIDEQLLKEVYQIYGFLQRCEKRNLYYIVPSKWSG